MNHNKIRISLLAGSIITIIINMFFLWILNINEPQKIQNTLLLYIFILGGIAIVTFILFFWKGPVFNIQGMVEDTNIMAMLLTVLVIIQLAFSFAAYSQKSQTLSANLYLNMRACITKIERSEGTVDFHHLLKEDTTQAIIMINLFDENNQIVTSSNEVLLKKGLQDFEIYEFPYFDNQNIQFVVTPQYMKKGLQAVLLNLLTAFVMSIIFSVEVVWLMIKLATEKIKQQNHKECIKPTALSYVRQIAFLFYFSSRLSSAFIPIMAKSFGNRMLGLSANGAAGIPQSSETFFTCIAIFVTTKILTEKGWKLPFGAGLLLVAAGTFLSALSPDLYIFILARAVVGLGYGFCWMTLRNLALFGKDAAQQAWGFSMLNAGLYAGMNCGASIGSVLAENLGYKRVFMVATVLTLLCSFFIIRMENAVLPRKDEIATQVQKIRFSLKEKIEITSFSVLLIAPSCIVAAYLSYFLPLYFDSIGRSISDVGRAQLLYGVIIVYIGPKLSHWLITRPKKLLQVNYLYHFLFSAGLLFVGIWGGMIPAMIAVLFLGVADSFGFSAQNNYFLDIPSIKRLGSSKSLAYLSFLKKMTEMLGPSIFAIVIIIGYEKGILLLGSIFLAALILFIGQQKILQRT